MSSHYRSMAVLDPYPVIQSDNTQSVKLNLHDIAPLPEVPGARGKGCPSANAPGGTGPQPGAGQGQFVAPGAVQEEGPVGASCNQLLFA